MCGRLDDDSGRLFLKCKAVKQCWWILEQVRCILVEFKSGAEVVKHILAMKEKEMEGNKAAGGPVHRGPGRLPTRGRCSKD